MKSDIALQLKRKMKKKFQNTTIGRCKQTPVSSQFYLFRLLMSDKIEFKNIKKYLFIFKLYEDN